MSEDHDVSGDDSRDSFRSDGAQRDRSREQLVDTALVALPQILVHRAGAEASARGVDLERLIADAITASLPSTPAATPPSAPGEPEDRDDSRLFRTGRLVEMPDYPPSERSPGKAAKIAGHEIRTGAARPSLRTDPRAQRHRRRRS